jgi:hypothetical protein
MTKNEYYALTRGGNLSRQNITSIAHDYSKSEFFMKSFYHYIIYKKI